MYVYIIISSDWMNFLDNLARNRPCILLFSLTWYVTNVTYEAIASRTLQIPPFH